MFDQRTDRLAFEDRVGRALGHAADGTHIRAVVAEISVDDISLFGGMRADGIARAGGTAGVTHDAEIGFDEIHNIYWLKKQNCFNLKKLAVDDLNARLESIKICFNRL